MFKIVSVCNGGGYRYCRTDPPHPKRNIKGLYPLHRVLLENKLGRLLRSDEECHHIDENKANDDPDNLELQTKSDHARHHRLKEAPKPVTLICDWCLKKFKLKPYQMRLRRGRNKTGLLFCSRACSTKGSATKLRSA